ncbi:hypothetical protein BDF14DRAFT_1183866 [Spinellus fusiger]|nr:hypothetical protein BDF14DRAFT_1183866 [Spinellus fusiger]
MKTNDYRWWCSVIDKKEKATLSQLQKKLKKLEEEQKEAVKFKKTTESYLQTLETDNKKLKDALAEAKKNIEEHEAAYMELAVNSDYKNEELTEDLAEAQKELIECRETLETNKKELEGMRQHTSTSESTAMVVMTGKYERIVTELHEAKVQIKQLEKEAVEKEKEREKEREKEKEKSQVMVYPSGEKVRQQEHTMSVALDFSSQLNELKQVFVVEIDTLKKQKVRKNRKCMD